MRCPKCEGTDWPLSFKWCPECGDPLPQDAAQKTDAAGTTLDQQGNNRPSAGNSSGDLLESKQQAPFQPTGEDLPTARCRQDPPVSSTTSHLFNDTAARGRPCSHYEGGGGAGVSQAKESQSTVLISKGEAKANLNGHQSLFNASRDGNPNGEAAALPSVAPHETDEFIQLAVGRMHRTPTGEQHHTQDDITQTQRQTSVENSIRSCTHSGGQQDTIQGIQADLKDSNKANRSIGAPELQRIASGSPDAQLKGHATQQSAFAQTPEKSQASSLSGEQQQSQGKQVDLGADLPIRGVPARASATLGSDRMLDSPSGSDKPTNTIPPCDRTLNGSEGAIGPQQQGSQAGSVNQQSSRSQNSVPGSEESPTEQTDQTPNRFQDTVSKSGSWYQKETLQQNDSANRAKSKKQQKKEEKERKKAAENTQSQISSHPPTQLVAREQGVTVIFHVFLVSNFKPEEINVFIRAHGVDLGDFDLNCVDMHVVDYGKAKDKERLVRFHGELTLSLDRARIGTHYKYVVVKKGNLHWEELVEFPPRYPGQFVDRFLKIPDNYIKPSAKWEQFDAVAYVYGDQRWYEKFKGLFFKEKTVPNRTDALLCCLPKWKGFFVGEPGDDMTASDALAKLIRIAQAFSSVWMKESGQHQSQRRPPDFDIGAALYDSLRPKMEENIQVLSQSEVGSSAHVSALVSSLAFSVVVTNFVIPLKKDEVVCLLKCLTLEADPTEKKCTAYRAVLAAFTEEFREFAVKAIESLCNQLMDNAWNSNPEWLLAVPLLHFLRGDSKPFQDPEFGGSYQKPEWWGATRLKINEIRRSDKQDYSTVWPQLLSAFKVDRLLKRTYLRAIPVFDLHKAASSRVFNVSDLCVALLTYFPQGYLMREKCNQLMQCMESMISLLKSKETTTSVHIESVDFIVTITLTLVKTCLTKLSLRDHADLICLTIKLFFASIQKRRFALSNTEANGNSSLSEDIKIRELLKRLDTKLVANLDYRMSFDHRSDTLFRELEVWSKLLGVVDVNQGFDEYRDFLTEKLRSRARTVDGKYLVEIFCEVDLDRYDRAVGESFTKLAFEAVEKIINSQRGVDVDHAFTTLSAASCQRHQSAEKYGDLLSMLLTNSWPRPAKGSPQTGVDPQAVEFLLTWNPMKGYLRFFDDKSGRGVILTPEGQETLLLATSLLDELKRLISDASITMKILTLLQSNRPRFLELLKTLSSQDNTERCLDERIEEIQEFQKTRKQVDSFIRMCDLIQPVNMSNLKTKEPLDLPSHKISDLCCRLEDNKVEVTFFQLLPEVKEILPQLQNVQDSSIFQELWAELGKKAQRTRENDEAKKTYLSLSDVVNQVWTPAFNAWIELVTRVMDGRATLREIDKHFGGFKGRTKELNKELNTAFSFVPDRPTGGSAALVQDRVDQIQRYQQLHQYASASATIWNFKEAMGFTGDFQIIEDLRTQLSDKFKQKAITSIGEQFAKAGKALECLTIEKAECFKAVVDSKRLIEWLRTTIKSTQELKVLVDLALISAGESDIETDRISNLHTSCLQFAPLIFDLRETEDHKVNFDDLAEVCGPIWKAVEADRTLPQKLYDTSRHLEWLKTIKDSHGSVAMTSLVQAEVINSRGVYTVGRLETGDAAFADQERGLSVNSVIKVSVPPKDGDEETEAKEYSLDELRDLQSKLMLIAGKASKGKDQVDTFVKNLEGVMRLATAYVNLSKSGFVHRLDWNQRFDCSKDQLEGESVIRELAEVSTAMEKCFENWKKKVCDARKEFKELNFFTTQQLIVLRRELAAAYHSNDLPVNNLQVLALLENVRPNLEAEHVKAAIQHAFKDILRVLDLPSFTATPSQADLAASKSILNSSNYLSSGSSNEIQTISVKKPKPVATSKIQSFLNAAEDAGHPEKLAIAALASLGVDSEEDDLLFWCLENADEENIDELYEEGLQNADIANELCPVDDEREKKSLEELQPGQDKGESKGGSELGASQTLLMGLPETTAAATDCLPDDNEAEIGQYLTLTQLGSVLRELALKGKGARDRRFPSYLKRGRPNLMLVPKDDVLATVLALYMYDKHQPLPSSDEVLICSPETTTEEVELLWRRVTGDFQGRFYCLVNADQLNFTVSKEAVIKLSVLTQGLAGKAGEHYGLVVVCSSENEDRANIVAALDQFRVAAPPCPSPKDIKAYLKRKFLAPRPQYGYVNGSKITWTAAGSLDPESLSVRVVSSERGGLGKSLFVRRLGEKLSDISNNDLVVTSARRCGSEIPLHVTVPLHGNSTDASMVIESLLPHAVKASTPVSRIFHLDISPAMRRGLDTLLFNLLVLGALCDQTGRVWRRRCTDLYVIEVTTTAPLPTGLSKEEQHGIQENQSGKSIVSKRPFYDLLPNVTCSTPKSVSCTLATTQRDPTSLDPLFDVKEFRSAQYQRVFQYLKLSNEGKSLDNFTFVPGNVDDDQLTCLNLLLRYCGIPNPSWSEIRHFVSFLNSQLRDCEQSIFCNMQLMRAVLAGSDVLNLDGFRTFVVRFMIQMSRDFATPSLTDENTLFYTEDNEDLERREIEQFVLRRSWESSPHPYLFFNQDHVTMTFLGFFINNLGDLVDPQTRRVLEKNVMSKALRNGLQAQRVEFTTDTDTWTKEDKINKLCSVMGVKWVHDPDQVYELTTDNVKKILAIHMRFRCNIPVIVMGETGCGKTRLIRYMCGLQSGVGGPRNMLLVKVHGGTTYEDIKTKVCQAEDMARQNQDKDIDTVLFFDEANTTEALSMIKEVMVDRRIEGRRIGVGLHRLQFIAACNPYRRHTDAMIHKLESAGLGYHVKTDESEDRLGHIPLRHLVYRVHALPGSMRPLIWDFGQLNPNVEELYTKQIVSRYVLYERNIPGDSLTVQSITAVLAASQKYMRDQSDECSFVSLRDVERAMQLMVWFYERVDTLGRLMRRVVKEERKEEGEDDEDEVTSDESDDEEEEAIDPITRALVLAIGVCYHAKLQGRREHYRAAVAKSFRRPCTLPGGQRQILREITSCQQAVLNELELGPNIARNTALSENVFMMVVCIELRIPLFVVGKPGSSKSLAKTVVADNMQGDAARSDVFKSFKQVHMASYQCSPLSTPEGIVATFRQCGKLQEGKNPGKFVSVVVLDEVGLAEDSPLMPLKTLHPLLEDGVTSADDVIQTDEKSQRVAFIGISNWALDPAKMNRGIMLSRGVPSERELVDSAMGICSTDKQIRNWITPLLPPLAQGYAELYDKQSNFETLKKCGKEEFFGLRDFYSLIKMVYSIAAKLGHRPRWKHLEHAIKRNFGGLTEGEPVEIFKRHFQEEEDDEVTESATTIRLIEASLKREGVADRKNFSENRYLLILTENYAALRIMQQNLLKSADDAVVIFGSSFPNDQEYTQICRNINRIKVCMETGRTVILLNLESLYESLYDALNQYYVYLGGQKYVDLGLGTHRVKCRVDDDFKLIVIAEKEVVYSRFPIPLINRLEKHYLVMSTSLTPEQAALVEKLRTWANEFAAVQGREKRSRDFTVGDAFVGYHEDTVPSIVMQVCNDIEEENVHLEDGIPHDTWENEVLKRSQELLIAMAAPDAVVRLPATGLAGQAGDIWDKYFNHQQHSGLAVFLSHILSADGVILTKKRQEGLFIQITTHSRLLTSIDLPEVTNETKFPRSTVECVTLQQFQTEQQFRVSVREFFELLGGHSGILLVQCDSGDENFNLIAGARHILMEERANAPENLNLPEIQPIHIVMVVQLSRVAGGCRNFVGYQGGKWLSNHIDELRPPGKHALTIKQLIDRPISELFASDADGYMASPKAQENAVHLLRSCVQAAACRIDDDSGSSERSTHRIELLLNLLPDYSQEVRECEERFVAVLIRRTYQLLRERDEMAYQAGEWLHSEALSGTGVHEWGTFRKALWQRVCTAVVPVLAELIALADRDGNLDLIRNDDSPMSVVWLKILDNQNIAELHYNKIISPVTNIVRERVHVLGSGAGGHLYSCRFPFSCTIKERAEKLLKEALSVAAQSNTSVVDSFRDLLKTSELGPIFDEIRYQHLASLTYLKDFFHMEYKPSYPEEDELVCEAILSSARELGAGEDDTGSDLVDIPLIHVAYSRLQSRISCFSRIVQCHPGVLPKLNDLVRGKSKEVLFDVVALQICLEEMTPSEEALLSPSVRRAWCEKVLALRPAVEEMMRKEKFGPVTELTANYGEKSKTILKNCRSMWQRCGAVRLFVEHVTFTNPDMSDASSENVLKLWKVLGEDTDFLSVRSLQIIERFLISCSRDMQDREDEKAASEFRRRSNAFFMELVSIFCFGEATLNNLEPEALSMLMRYVIGHQSTQTKDFSPFPDYGIDPTPVVRSFLLQQLLRSSIKLVKEHLEVFLQEAQGLKPDAQHINEVCFLTVQCMEDALIGRHQTKIADSKLTVKIKHAKKTCDDAFKVLSSENESFGKMSVNALEAVAKGRYVLTVIADYMHKCLIERDTSWKDLDVEREMATLLESAEQLCCKTPSRTSQLYLLKQLARRYGLDCVRTLGGYREVEWILPADAREQDEEVIQDRFIVYENSYLNVRNGVAKAIISGNRQDIIAPLTSDVRDGVNKEAILLLALYREVTLRNASVQQQVFSDEMKEKLINFLQTGGQISMQNVAFAKQLVENTQGGQNRRLQIGRDKTPLEHTLIEIVIHSTIVLHCLGSGTLAEPLRLLMEDPAKMKTSYLPTMPEDNLLECISVIQSTMQGTPYVGEWYECGHCYHPYFVGECAKPMEQISCPDCGKVMGGGDHKFSGEWRTSDRKDRTKTGHALGDPGSRATVAEPQRNMSPLVCSLLRSILHAAMIMGASRNPQAISEMISPPVKQTGAAEVMWNHLQRDLDVLGRALGKSIDDAALIVHLVLQRMLTLRGMQAAGCPDMQLQTKESRRTWEERFTSAVIVPVVANLDANLQKAIKLLMGDERFGRDPLVRQLYQFDEQLEDLSQEVSTMSRSLWRYRRQITIEQLGHSFQQETLSGDAGNYKVLGAFLKEEHKLRSVQFLPDVVRLQRLLMDRFHRRIDKEDAEKFTIRKFLQTLPKGPIKDEHSGLIQSYRNAWNSCRSFLGNQGRLRVPLDLCNTVMDLDCPITMLLPSTRGMGVCATSLTFFLVNTNDEFLGTYRSATNQESPLERVSVSEVTASHLIAYDPEKDLMPLILAHCNYSLEVGQETLIQYNWATLERQLIDRFLRGRPFVDFKEERFAFSRDTRDDAVFASLKDKIPQVPISRAIEGQIVAEFRSSLADICDVLSSLDIAIGFLASSGGGSDIPLSQYLHVVLRLPRERGLRSPTAEQHCLLSHTLALWRLMALERAKMMSRNRQEPFEQIREVFKKKLSSSSVAHLNRVLRRIDMDLFLPSLLEMILLKIKQAGDEIITMSFQEYFELYLAEKGLEPVPGTENIPDDVTMEHLKAVWNSAVQLAEDYHKGSQPVAA